MQIIADINHILERINWIFVGFGTAGALWLLVLLIRTGRRSPLLALSPIRHERIPPELALMPVLVLAGVTSFALSPLGQWFDVSDIGDSQNTLARGVNALSYGIATVCAAIASYWVGAKYVGRVGQTFVLGKGRWLKDIAAGWCAVFVAFALCQGVLYATHKITLFIDPAHTFPEHNVINLLRARDRPGWLVPLLWIVTPILTPIAEEFFFRGLLQTLLCRWLRNRWIAILATSLIFGIAHADQPQVIPAITVFGIILGVTYERTGSLVGPIVAHALFNAKSLLWVTLATM